MMLLHSVLLAATFAESKIPVRTCYNERHRVGTGVPLANKKAVAEDKNLIVAVAPVLSGAGSIKNGAVPIGYVLTLVTGEKYYEFGSNLTPSEQSVEKTFLTNAGIDKHVDLDQLIRTGGSAVIRFDAPSNAYARSHVHLQPCTAITKSELNHARK